MMSIAEMHLDPEVEKKAEQLLGAAPHVKFLSGRRTVAEQSRAMAGNVVHSRRWIAETYRASPAIHALQAFVDHHPQATTVEALAAGLEEVMNGLPLAERLSISRHLVGKAFDLVPDSAPPAAIMALKPRRFLTHEGGLLRWHVEFD